MVNNPNKDKALLLWLSQDDREFIGKQAKKIQAVTGERASASSVLRALIARYRQEVGDNPSVIDNSMAQYHR